MENSLPICYSNNFLRRKPDRTSTTDSNQSSKLLSFIAPLQNFSKLRVSLLTVVGEVNWEKTKGKDPFIPPVYLFNSQLKLQLHIGIFLATISIIFPRSSWGWETWLAQEDVMRGTALQPSQQKYCRYRKRTSTLWLCNIMILISMTKVNAVLHKRH